MKKILLTVCALFFVFAAPLTAFEWGGLFTNDTGITTPDFSNITFNQSNGISIWFNTPLGEDFALSGEVLYKYNFSKPKDVDATFDNIVDLPLFKVSGETEAGSGILSLNAGRFAYVDNAGAVVSSTIDGVAVDYTLDTVKLGVVAGYSGLLNSLNTKVRSAADVAGKEKTKFYDLAYGYAPIGLSVEFPYLLSNQSLGIQAYALLDCGSQTQKTNCYFANLSLSGPIANIIYYNLSSTVESTDFKKIMNYSAFSLMIFPTQEISVNAGVDFGSAFDGNYYVSPLSTVEGGQITPKASFTYATNVMCFDLGAKYILAYNAADKNFAGKSLDLNTGFIYNIFSDLQVGLSINASIGTAEPKVNNYSANLNIALAF